MTTKRDGGSAFPAVTRFRSKSGIEIDRSSGMTLRDWFAGTMQADDRLVKCVRAMDDTALEMFAKHPDSEREEWITEKMESEIGWITMTELEKITTRLTLEAKAIARVRFMQADAMLAERDRR